MSRTYKDIPKKFRDKRWDWDWVWDTWYDTYQGLGIGCKKPGIFPKLKKRKDTENHWMSTPSAWTRLMMNRPERAARRAWEQTILRRDIEEYELPDTKRKPHIYYW
jgi:hypothetical protein